MGLQTGNVETNPGTVPEPSITVEEFRARYTDAHREALYRAVLAHEREKKASYQVDGLSGQEAFKKAHAETAIAREALQLIGKLHPESYKW